MFMLTQKEDAIINLDDVQTIYISNSKGICVRFKNGSGCELAQYNSSEEKEVALKLILKQLNSINMPTEKEIRAIIINSNNKRDDNSRTTTGHKIRRHGGS